MKPLILFTAMTVIGLFGIIGTVEYSHAQTIMTLEPLPNTPETKVGQTHAIYINPPDRNYWYTANRPNGTFQNSLDVNATTREYFKPIGEIFIPGPRQPLESNPILLKYNETKGCSFSFDDVNVLLNNPSRNNETQVKDLVTPPNIKEQGNDITAIGINWQGDVSDTYTCPIDLEAPSKHPLFLTKELRYSLYNQSDNKAYHFSPSENIIYAQAIPLCTTDNLNTNTQTLKGDTKMCYGKHGNNMIIITKKLTGFYGATEQFVITEYQKLLNRLYLPPI